MVRRRDKHTAFFFQVTRGRRTINRFTVLEDANGNPFHEEAHFSRLISDYFRDIFTRQSSGDFEVVNDTLSPCITQEMNNRLIAIPTAEEIRLALFSISAKRAPGPDGFSAGFFHSFWPTLGADLVKEIQDFFRTGSFPVTHNETNVRLIPKGAVPRKVADYRPIALCNVYYKIVAKILTKRLQPILPGLISENQSAFVPGRAISDNVLITHETLHYLRTSKARVYGSMAVKTDISKAYDRIEWGFLQAVLERFGFHLVWISWIMECVTTV